MTLPGVGTFRLSFSFLYMTDIDRSFPSMTDTSLFEQSFNIAWSVLQKTGELGEPNDAARFLFDEIARMMRCGERRRLLLSNSAIDAYRRRPVRLVQWSRSFLTD